MGGRYNFQEGTAAMKELPAKNEMSKVFFEIEKDFKNDMNGIFRYMLNYFEIKSSEQFELFYEKFNNYSLEWTREIVRKKHEMK